MLRLNCPFCGLRDHTEFTYLEDAEHAKPDVHNADMRDWFESVYLRENPRGPHLEYWHHALGCRTVLMVERDTVTHEIRKVEPAHPEMRKMYLPASSSPKKPSGKKTVHKRVK